LARNVGNRSAGTIAAVGEVIKSVYNSMVDAQFAGFASENSALKTLVTVPAVTEGLQKMAGLQDVEHERDLPATIAAAR
jgi:hypothetical protein